MGELIAIILVGFGTILGCLVLWKIFHVIKSSIDKNEISIREEDFTRLARAFVQHKKEMQERVQNIEAIIADKNEGGEDLHYSQLEEPQGEDRLTNDLQQKRRDR